MSKLNIVYVLNERGIPILKPGFEYILHMCRRLGCLMYTVDCMGHNVNHERYRRPIGGIQ